MPSDEFGPARVLHIHGPRLELKAITVIDNAA